MIKTKYTRKMNPILAKDLKPHDLFVEAACFDDDNDYTYVHCVISKYSEDVWKVSCPFTHTKYTIPFDLMVIKIKVTVIIEEI